ncbi:MAG: hypothetical protein ACRDRN_20165 [Sciscionella sp.]
MVTQHNTDTAVSDATSSDGGEGLSRAELGAALARQWRWLVPLAVIMSTGAWVSGTLAGGSHGTLRIALIVLGAVFTAVAVGVPLLQQHRASQARADAVETARAARARMQVALEDALDPFVYLLKRLSSARSREKAQLRGEAIQLAVTTIAALAGTERVRVCFFALDPGHGGQLHPERFAGRAGAPNTSFACGSRQGNAALAIANGVEWTYLDDLNETPPPCWWDSEHDYRTMLAGPVATPEAAAGLLTLDALHPGELARVDVTLVKLLTDMLAVALSL